MNCESPYFFNSAIVRRPSNSVTDGLRDGSGPDPDFGRLCNEHVSYVKALENAGVEVHVLPALKEYPDSLFVEDPALVFTDGAILLRPGAPSREGEVTELSAALYTHFDRVLTLGSGFADGGDMLLTPNGVMIGLSSRTDIEGANALQLCLESLDIPSQIVQTPEGVLHFKSDCSLLDEERVLSTQRLAASSVFKNYEVVEVPDGEEAAANALRVNNVLLVGENFPRTIDCLDQLGYNVVSLPTAEIAKIDAGLSCMSLRWKKPLDVG